MSIDTSYSPRTGEINGTVDHTADLESALARAEAAAPVLAAVAPATRAAWIGAVADALGANSEELATLADEETALGMPRLTGEVARAVSQLRFYASVAVEGSYLQARIDRPSCSSRPDGADRSRLRHADFHVEPGL